MTAPEAPAPQRDGHTIGMLFVGVLFAAVITKTLDLSSTESLPATGAAHLILAAVLVITSWIGYHNSTGRSTCRIEFFNLP